MNKANICSDGLFELTVKKITFSNAPSVTDVFSQYSDSAWSMWLDSCDTQHVDSRFDILVFNPLITLSTIDESTTVEAFNLSAAKLIGIKGINKPVQFDTDPLSLLSLFNEKVFGRAVTKHPILPFIGGAVGAFSYDLGRRFEKFPSKAAKDITFPDMAVGIYHQAIIFDNTKREYWLVCPEDERIKLEEKIVKGVHKLCAERIKAKPTMQKVEDKVQASTLCDKPSIFEGFSLTSPWHSNMNKAAYKEKFVAVQQYLLSGDCYQINLAQRFKASYQGNEFIAYKTLRQENKAPFSAFIRLDNSAILSLSPERFLQSSQGRVQSKPIKGTIPRSQNIAVDLNNANILKASTKDRAENLMIVDLLRNDISKVCIPGTVKVPKLFDIESFPAVHHLVSTVVGDLNPEKTASDLLRGAFPGGSITGAPKIRAMEIIESLEPHRRSIYCGSIGYISCCGTMDSSITIRTLICQSPDKSIYCWAGGGLVADSNVDSEYQETFDKVQRILPVLSRSK